MEQKVKLEELSECERLVYYILLKVNSDKTWKNEHVELITMEYLREVIKFLKREGILENDLRRIN